MINGLIERITSSASMRMSLATTASGRFVIGEVFEDALGVFGVMKNAF
jgi:hypothetical protein